MLAETKTSIRVLSLGNFVVIEISLNFLTFQFFPCRDDPLLCISDALICDGIRNCPIGGGMFNDEDDYLCKKHRFDDQDLKNVILDCH